ncbi:MAG: hypothetical protein AB1422_17825 [bacterium]
MFEVPLRINNEFIYSLEREKIHSVNDTVIAQLSLFPIIRTSELKRTIDDKFYAMQKLSVRTILNDLKQAAQVFRKMNFNINGIPVSRQIYIDLVSESTGLNKSIVSIEIEEIACMLENLGKIIAIQLPGNLEECIDHHYYIKNGQRIGYYPTGKSLIINLPGNIPTICFYWLIPFAQKRPVFLIPAKEDPFTHLFIIEAIAKVNPLLASFISFIPCKEVVQKNIFNICDQILISESYKSIINRSIDLIEKTFFIHYGRSKFLFTEQAKTEHIAMLYRRMIWNAGRTCTGLTSVVTTNNGEWLAREISSELIKNHHDAGQLSKLSYSQAKRINDYIETYIERGDAIDITEQLRNTPRLLQTSTGTVLYPTVLFIKNKKSDIFGTELF